MKGDAGQALGPAQVGTVAPLKGVFVLLYFSWHELTNVIDGVEGARITVPLLTVRSTMAPVVTL